MDFGFGIGGIIGLILDIWAVINILQSGASNVEKLLWILLILLLPLIGFIIWLLQGRGGRGVTFGPEVWARHAVAGAIAKGIANCTHIRACERPRSTYNRSERNHLPVAIRPPAKIDERAGPDSVAHKPGPRPTA